MIARYTQKLMDDLTQTGKCKVVVTSRLNEAAARARINNAANRLGFRVGTTKTGYKIIGRRWA